MTDEDGSARASGGTGTPAADDPASVGQPAAAAPAAIKTHTQVLASAPADAPTAAPAEQPPAQEEVAAPTLDEPDVRDSATQLAAPAEAHMPAPEAALSPAETAPRAEPKAEPAADVSPKEEEAAEDGSMEDEEDEDDDEEEEEEEEEDTKSGAAGPAQTSREARKAELAFARTAREQEQQLKRRIRRILKVDKPRSEADEALLRAHAELARAEQCAIERSTAKRDRDEARTAEVEDSAEELREKVSELARWLKHAKHAVVYTGAGMSTAAQIPDYRGPEGVWTLRKKGVQATMPIAWEETRPTGAHMALRTLVRRGRVRHVVSQNVDGLHLRSGVAPAQLSELHGNIYREVCTACGKRYLRAQHVTERSSFHHHKTGRSCALKKCAGAELRDTIVYFGERLDDADLEKAREVSRKADLAIFLGSSLKVLQHYKFIWERSGAHGEKRFVIVNLQWTPKDRAAQLKINGRCDVVLQQLLGALNLKCDAYSERADPIAALAPKGAAVPAPHAAAAAPSRARAPPKSRAFPSVVRAAEPPRVPEAGGAAEDAQAASAAGDACGPLTPACDAAAAPAGVDGVSAHHDEAAASLGEEQPSATRSSKRRRTGRR